MDNEAKRETNQLLLNAIQQKFESRQEGGDNNKSLDSTQIIIPALKTPPIAVTTSSTNVPKVIAQDKEEQRIITSSPLNQFLLNQLRQNKINGLSDGFKLPELKVPAFGGDNNLNIPLLKRLANADPISTAKSNTVVTTSPEVTNIEKGVRNLQIDTAASHLTTTEAAPIDTTTTTSKTSFQPIDLSTALICNLDVKSANPRPAASSALQMQKPESHDFIIPFIDCDRLGKSTDGSSGVLDEFCSLSVRDVEYNHRLAKPSAFGFAFCADDKCSNKRYFPCAATSLDKLHLKIYKHIGYATNIKRFRFDEKSPDDLVKESLSQYQRTSHT